MSVELSKISTQPTINILVAEDQDFPAMVLAIGLNRLTNQGYCFWRVADGKNAQNALMGRKFTACKLEGGAWQEQKEWGKTFFWGAVLDCQMPRKTADGVTKAKEGIYVAKHIRAWEETWKARGIGLHTYLFAHSSDNYPEFDDKKIFDANLGKGYFKWENLFSDFFKKQKLPADEKEK